MTRVSSIPGSASARSWHQTNTFSHHEFSVGRLVDERRFTVSVCLPARNEARTIGTILGAIMPLRDQGLVDEIVVVDASRDGTAEIARELGAVVYAQERLMPELGPVMGKGDAMWRALSVLHGDCVCFLDADSERFGAHYVCGLLGPLICRQGISFVKGFYRRPFRIGDVTLADEGGRVTELTARPLLNLFYPELAAVEQPLAGEIAARRELVEQLAFVTGYGVDIGLLVDVYRLAGLQAIAQVDLDVRQNAHRPLRELGPMASDVLHAVTVRLEREGRLRDPFSQAFPTADPKLPTASSGRLIERPPLANLRAAA